MRAVFHWPTEGANKKRPHRSNRFSVHVTSNEGELLARSDPRPTREKSSPLRPNRFEETARTLLYFVVAMRRKASPLVFDDSPIQSAKSAQTSGLAQAPTSRRANSRWHRALGSRFRGPSAILLALLVGAVTQTSARANAPSSNLQRSPEWIRPLQPTQTLPVQLHHIKRGDTLDIQLFDRQGELQEAALRDLRGFLACTKTGEDHPIHWRVVSILVAVAQHWPQSRILIYSGYRNPRVSHHAKRSNHTRGRAIDFRVEGVSNRVVFESLRRSFRDIGLGYYPNSRFVHLDIRESDGVWVDYAGPGERACYSPHALQDLADGSADRLDEASARKRGCKGHDRLDRDQDNPSDPNASFEE